jgi:DNA-binding SARP family transcriptional activator
VTEGIKNLEQQRFDEAERDFRGALALMPYMRIACDSLVQVQAQQGKKQEALQSLEQCQRIFPDRDRANSIRALLK